MADNSQDGDGRNSLLGEFLVALARSPEHIQEAVVVFGLKQFQPYARDLIDPYPMLTHMAGILARHEIASGGNGKK